MNLIRIVLDTPKKLINEPTFCCDCQASMHCVQGRMRSAIFIPNTLIFNPFSYTFTNYSPFLNHKITGLWQLIIDTRIYRSSKIHSFTWMFKGPACHLNILIHENIQFFVFFHGLWTIQTSETPQEKNDVM